ncbi:MAG: molybdopterin-synthase adenylyltransferase MoeB [Kineosporiaceae bacterium]
MAVPVNGQLPPLVEPGPPLSVEQRARYARHLTLASVGEIGQRRLLAANVAVVGAGGLGSPVLLYLAAAGVGRITVLDDDVVDESNLQRQVLHPRDAIGTYKVDSARERLSALNDDVLVRARHLRLDASNALDVLTGHDLVIDGSDNLATRYLVDDACSLLGVPLVWGAIDRFDGQVSVFWQGHGPTYRDLHPVPPPPGTVPNCAEAGVVGALCGVIGSVMATEAVKLITGAGRPLLGRVLVHDALAATWRELRLRPDPTREPVTAIVPTADETCAVPGAVESLDAEGLDSRLAARAAGSDAFVLVDVREPAELAAGAVPGSVNVPLSVLSAPDGVSSVTSLPAAADGVVVYCASGVRSAAAVALLREAGVDAVHVAGGYRAWRSRPAGSGARG